MADLTFLSAAIAKANGERLGKHDDRIAVEEPMELRLGRSPIAITMRTPGHDRDLVAGFLLTERIIESSADIGEIAGPRRNLPNVITARLRRGLKFDQNRLNRYFHATSSCGLCGKTTLEAIGVRVEPITSDTRIALPTLYSLPHKLRAVQETFEETGGLHAAALFSASGVLEFAREDVGRHNAVDKVIGAALLAGRFPLESRILMVSGRASFEILQKALVARIPIVAAVSAPSSLAVALARKFKMTLVGFLRADSCNIYSGPERVRG
jgi:FdhD protein